MSEVEPSLPIAKSFLQDVPSYSVSESVEDIKKRFQLTDVVYLASNENPYGCSPRVAEVLQTVATSAHRYPDGDGTSLKQLMSKRFEVDTSCLMLGNGSNEILDCVAKAFLGPGDELLISEHSFAMYPIFAKCFGAQVKSVPMNDWYVDLDGLLNAISESTKVIVIANANNPTGTILTEPQLKHFLESVPASVLVVLDEAYIEYAEPQLGTALSLLSDFSNVLISRTFSKAYGLAGFRIGYGIGQPKTIQTLEKIRQPFNVNLLALSSAEQAFLDADFLAEVVSNNCTERQIQMTFFAEHGIRVLPSQTNFMAIEIPSLAAECYQYLLSKGVIVRPLKSYQMSDWLRVSIGTNQENERFRQAFSQFMEQKQ